MHNKVAIMQPYIFPYVGYMNLVNASDNFVFYDDVNFIKKGWINRNRIMLMGEPFRFSIPLKRQSQNILIKDTEVADLVNFADKFLAQLKSSYKISPHKSSVLDYVREVLAGKHVSISEVAIASVELFFTYVGISKSFRFSSKEFGATRGMDKAERLIAITELLQSNNYINAIGGTTLYDKEFFSNKGVNLQFVKPVLLPYEHCNGIASSFNAGLSIIDLMMNVSVEEIRAHLNSFELV
ncbi:WbqC family protein [Rhodobacteraceae bacterium]|nr:WbqC family protein [Paracoccaceae bacterium]